MDIEQFQKKTMSGNANAGEIKCSKTKQYLIHLLCEMAFTRDNYGFGSSLKIIILR